MRADARTPGTQHDLVILGSGGAARALHKVLGLTTGWNVGRAELKPQEVERLRWILGLKGRGRIPCRRVLMFAGPVAQVAPWIRRLRGEPVLWDGSLVVVCSDSRSCAALMSTDLVGDGRDEHRFQSVPGHRTIASPIRLSEVLSALSITRGLSWAEWQTCVRASRLESLRRLARASLASIKSGDHDAGLRAFGRALDLLKTPRWNWEHVLGDHSLAGELRLALGQRVEIDIETATRLASKIIG